MVLVGSAAGLALGMASARYIEALLYQVKLPTRRCWCFARRRFSWWRRWPLFRRSSGRRDRSPEDAARRL